MTHQSTSSALLELAEKLTEFQRLQLREAHCMVPRNNPEWTAECVCSIGATAFPSLAQEGLVFRRETFPGGYLLTEKGEQLRQHLLSRARNGGQHEQQ